MASIEDVLLGLVGGIAGKTGWLNEKLNGLLIDKLVNAGRTRPHPWSTKSPYISWASLTDRTYNTRLLPPSIAAAQPPSDQVAALFAAPSGQRQCNKSTMLFPAFAQYLTDGFIRTQLSNIDAEENRARTTSNHEIDQSPLYGRTPAQTDALRLKSNDAKRKGRLKSLMIGDEEFMPLLFLPDGKTLDPQWRDANGVPVLDSPLGITKPWAVTKTMFAAGGDRVNAAPQVAMMNTLFLREHNRLALLIETANPEWDDTRVFETARNCLIVLFIRIVVEEYINHISGAPFSLRALSNVAWKAGWNRPNWITAEFSLLYRWHSLIPETLTWGGQTMPGGAALLNNALLIDHGLVASFEAVSANRATQLGLDNTASFLVPIEGKAIEQARHVGLAPYNDYRAAMGKKRHDDFDAVVGRSKDPAEQTRRAARSAKLKALYGHPDKLEFYVGIFAEPTTSNGVLPELLMAMVAMDAFSQALTNPLLSLHIWGNETTRTQAFTKQGLAEIESASTLRALLARNSAGLGNRFVGMTRPGWKRA